MPVAARRGCDDTVPATKVGMLVVLATPFRLWVLVAEPYPWTRVIKTLNSVQQDVPRYVTTALR